MAVTQEDVRHVATLARVGLSDARAASLVAELNTILGHMAVRRNQYVYDLYANLKPVARPAAISNLADDDGWTAERDLDKCAKSQRRGQGNPNPGA